MLARKRLTASNSYICSHCARSLRLILRKYATSTSPDIYDVVCIGGGPVGLSLLTALRSSEATSHLRLALVETQDLDRTRKWYLPPDQYSNRVSSLTPASQSFLSRVGVWEHVDVSRVQPFNHMRVWDGVSSTGRISFDSPAREPAIAHMTENQNLTRALIKHLDELAPVTLFDKTSVDNIHLGPATEPSFLNLSSYPHVVLSSRQTVVARLLVGADGINGPVRNFANIRTRGWDYDRHGLVATLRIATDKLQRVAAYQRFLPSGPIALLPIPGNMASLVWTTTPAQAARLKSLQRDDFLAMVNAAFRLSTVDTDYMFSIPSGQLNEFQWRESVHPSSTAEDAGEIPPRVESLHEGSVASFPLRLRQATSYVTDRMALIGDAAHTIHPLAGQGLNMGLADAQSLASAIEYAVLHGADIGKEMTCLERYNADMWMSNNRMLGAVDKLHWLYSVGSGPIVGLRGWGLRAVDALGPLKGWFMRQAGSA